MHHIWKRITAVAVLSTSVFVASGGVNSPAAHASGPVFPVFEEIGEIPTSPFNGVTPPRNPGDLEGSAFDPNRGSLWVSDDSKFQLYELEFTPGAFSSGRLRNTIYRKDLSQARPFGNLAGPPAGDMRAADLEGMAYDAVNDTLYAFAGSCCPAAPHSATAFRLTRDPLDPAPALLRRFKVADYQPLSGSVPPLVDPVLPAGVTPDFSGVAATGGQLWVGNHKNLIQYDYATNTFAAPVSLATTLNSWGDITGLDFTDEGGLSELWMTTSSERLIKLSWPAHNIVPNYIIDPRVLQIPDARAVESFVYQGVEYLAIPDGYDSYTPGDPEEFAVRVFNVTASVPAPVFTANPSTVGAGGTVSFQETSTKRPTSVTWNFGDGSAPVTVPVPDILPPSPPNPSPPVPYRTAPVTHTYTTVGTYTVTLTATNPNGSASTTAVITVTPAPAADFTATPASGTAPLPAQFADTSTGSAPTSWAWNFGDNTTSTEQNPAHTFSKPGAYTVTFTATNSFGSSTVHKVVQAFGPPVANFSSAIADPTNAPLVVDFRNLSTGYPAPASYKWEFGDGGASTDQNANHAYAKGGQYFVKLTATGPYGATTKTLPVTVIGGSFVGINPKRLLDTRPAQTFDGAYSGTGRIGAGTELSIPVLGRGANTNDPIPTDGIQAVALNVTAIGPSASSYLTVWPKGATRPNASNLNYSPGQTIPNMVIVKLGADGAISLYNEAGNVDLAIDLLGFFPAGPSINSINPERLLDTRAWGTTIDHQFQGGGAVGVGATLNVKLAGRAGTSIPAGVGSVALNVTVTNPTADSYLTVWPKGRPQPNASNLNFSAGQTIPNMVLVPLSPSGEVSIYNSLGSTDVLVDVLAYFPPAGGTSVFRGLPPDRFLDTRLNGQTFDDQNKGAGPVGPRGVITVPVRGRGGVPANGVGSVALNVTVVDTTAESYMTVWPGGNALQPEASNLNYGAGATIPNTVIVPIGADGTVSLFNSAGSTNVIVDVLGYFPS